MCKRKAARAANRGCPGDRKATESGNKGFGQRLWYSNAAGIRRKSKQRHGGGKRALQFLGPVQSRPACALSLTRPVRRVVLMGDDWVQTILLALLSLPGLSLVTRCRCWSGGGGGGDG